MKRRERRSFLWEDFISELRGYYDARDCDVVFEMSDDGSCIAEFTVHPRGKKYFFDKKAFDPEAGDPQEEALGELRRILFPGEPVTVLEIIRSPLSEDSDIVMIVETGAPDSNARRP